MGGNGSRRKKQTLLSSEEPRLTPSEQAFSRSQGGPMAGLLFTCCPVSPQGAHFLCPVQVAGVAVHSTRVAITVLVISVGFWVTEGSPWRVQPFGCAARLELESP